MKEISPTSTKRNYADVLVNGNEGVNDSANETKAVEGAKINEIIITDNIDRRKKNKVKRDEKER